MGFLRGLANIAQGKPVFVAPTEQNHETRPIMSAEPEVPTSPVSTVDKAGYKLIPEIELEHVETHLNGNEMEVTVWVTNKSTAELELDKIVMLGVTLQLDRFFRPGEAHELRLYKGNVPTSDSYHTANLYYKQVTSGDYFCADFTIKYDYDSKGFYTVDGMHPVRPVRDV